MSNLSKIADYFKNKDIYYDEDVVLKISKVIEKDTNINTKELESKLNSIRTDFFRINKMNKKQVAKDLVNLLNTDFEERKKLGINEKIINVGKNLIEKMDDSKDIFYEMKKIVEAFLKFFEQRFSSIRNEKHIQELLDTYLNATFKERVFTVKELGSGDGFLDILLIYSKNDSIYKILFELKIFYSPSYYKKGLKRLSEYMETERLDKSFYIICDPRKSAKSAEYTKKTKSGEIFVYIVKKRKK
ncbi:MAG: hypothetical protein KAS04_01710 [Candidatus Aenigmarchaeota archaeon]|nr:hypothetical protein [Candidatus Aenigmarchaeota archaeon]